MRIFAVVVTLLSVLLVLGQISGNQPERDSVAAASAELGLEFEGRMIDVGEVSLHVVFAGPADGDPVILLHGFPEFWYAWRGPGAVLARAGFRVIIPDQRGYNLSEKPSDANSYRRDRLVGDVIGLMDQLGIEQVSLAVQDLGGAVGWRTVLEYPERVRRIAIIDAFHPLAEATGEEEVSSWHRSFLQLPWLPGYAARVGNWWLLSSNLRRTSAPGAFADAELDQLRSAWDRDGAIHSMGAWYRAEPWPVAGDGRIDVPTLVILAKDDTYIPASATRASMAFLENGELLELGSGTHWVSAEEPERIGRILLSFFGR